ncbi:DUF4082 domain-containing protein [Hymenobacter humi]|uniref:DUF4082 domain-containing protein n=1 Tax=Hymenobacter humi TaxID=1411620 RepID=A0ABW2U9I6_9BACT
MGLTPAGGTLADQYLLVNTASGPGRGIVDQTIQFHGTADLYTLASGTTSLATLYSSATAATSNPAVSQRLVGTNGGKAIAFAYDLARSVVYTRQGNPAWAGQKRDGEGTNIRSDDMFFPDWVDLNKVAIPQADEQQRLLANIMVLGSKKPLPRFWYLPKGLKAAVVMTGDDHGSGGTKARFDSYITKSASNTPQAVADWTAIRGSSYIYPGTPITDAQAAAYEAQGFELSLHLNTNCAVWTPSTLRGFFNDQLSELAAKFPSLSKPVTHRTHCIAWSDWASEAKIELENGIRFDDNYYYWPEKWVQDRPGMFTGSGMPMRFADLDGSLIDVYQATTQLTDESGITYSTHINALLDNAIGSKGYYGVFTANMHTDFLQSSIDGSNTIIAAAQQRQVPVVSAKQMLTWLDGRNNSSFGAMTWDANKLNFTVSLFNNVLNIQGMLPVVAAGGNLTALTANGAPVTYRKETIKGIEYAFFPANPGTYVASYDGAITACTPPTATIAAVEPAACAGSPVSLKLSAATGQAPYTLVVNGTTYSNVTVGQTFAIFTPGEVSIWGSTGTPATPYATDNQPIEIGTKFRASVNGTITGVRFYKGVGNTGAHVGTLWSSAGTKLASATFSNETASGWQEVRFDAPVAVTAGTTYIASYYSPDGGFAISPGFFTSTGVTNGPLTALQSGTDGVNGVYKYGGGFPNGGNTANYWVDVLFAENTAAGKQTYTLTSITDANACNATNTSLSSVEVTPGTGPAGTLAASGAVQAGQDINLTFTASAGTSPFSLVINGTTYPNVTSGTPFNTGVKASTSGTTSIWSSTTVPATVNTNDSSPIEVGVKFRAAVDGQVMGIRFYKGSENTGTHVGSLWSSTGTKLATATFSNETASGWQEVRFDAPVDIKAGTLYVASYSAPIGKYSSNGSYFTTAVTNGPLTAVQSGGADGSNGVYNASGPGAFPTSSFNSSNYWVDVVFATSGGNTFSLTSITDSKGCVKQGTLQTLTVQPTAGTNTAPVLASIGTKSATVGTALSFTATATDESVSTLAYSLAPATTGATLPAGAQINASTGVFSWTPTAGQVGSHTFKVVVTDAGSPALSDEEAITVTVTGTTATAQSITFTQPLPDVSTSAGPITLTATASSNLPVTYSATGPATVSGSTLTLSGSAGVVTVTASQAGDATYAAATPVPRSFTVSAAASTACFTDQSAADFLAGNTGSNTYRPASGGIQLKPQVEQDFTTAPPTTEWQNFPWGTGGTTAFSGGQAVVDGSRFNTEPTTATSQPGASVEFVATFGATGFQHVGFGAGDDAAMYAASTSSWAMFSTGTDAGTGLKARVNNAGTQTDVVLPGALIGTAHRYRIDWNPSSIDFYIDGTLAQTTPVALTLPMRVGASDYNVGGATLSLDEVRLMPYASPGSFISRVFDAGTAKTWKEAIWTADQPAGTAVKLFQRQGSSATPDATWTEFTAVASSGATVGGSSRYIQYRADLSTTNPALTPTLRSVAVNCGDAPAECPALVFAPVTGSALTAATAGTAYSQTIATTPTGYTFSVTGLPAGLSINETTGAISGTTSVVVTNAAITVTATKGTCTATASYTLTVSATPWPTAPPCWRPSVTRPSRRARS